MPMKRKGYSFANHTADVELVARGKTLDEAFANAALALFETSADISRISRLKEKPTILKVKEHSDNLADLLWLMLQDMLSIADSKGVYAYAVKKMKINHEKNSYNLYSEFVAKEEKPEYSNIYVKGVSRYDLKVTQTQKAVKITAVLDV